MGSIFWVMMVLMIFLFLLFLSMSTPMSRTHKQTRETLRMCLCEEGCPCKDLHGENGLCSCVPCKDTYCVCDSACPCKTMRCTMDSTKCPCRIRTKLYKKSSSRTKEEDANELLLDRRANSLMQAWNDTLTNRLLNTTDPNVMYDMWYSNMARRGLAPLYATQDVFHISMPLALNRTLTLEKANVILEPYLPKERLVCKPTHVNAICKN
jgi:hypothetical protein